MKKFKILHKGTFKGAQPVLSNIEASSWFDAIFSLQMDHGKHREILKISPLIKKKRLEHYERGFSNE